MNPSRNDLSSFQHFFSSFPPSIFSRSPFFPFIVSYFRSFFPLHFNHLTVISGHFGLRMPHTCMYNSRGVYRTRNTCIPFDIEVRTSSGLSMQNNVCAANDIASPNTWREQRVHILYHYTSESGPSYILLTSISRPIFWRSI